MKELELRDSTYRLPKGCKITKVPVCEDVYVVYIAAGTMSDTVVLSAKTICHESSLSFGKDMVVGKNVKSDERVYINCAHILKVVPRTMVTVVCKPENDNDVIVDIFLIKRDTKLNIVDDNKLSKEVLWE